MSKWRGSWFRATHRAFCIEQILPRKPGGSEFWPMGPHWRDLLPGERSLGRYILPPFQRPSVWTLSQKIRLIESLLDELPVPPYVANRDMQGFYQYHDWLLDGQQRITAILEFLDGQFPVREVRFPDASTRDQRWFLNQPFHCLETELRDERLLKEVHDRLAYGGTPHEIER